LPFPTPRLGLVIGYSYLWLSEHQRGLIEGTKNRPCAIVQATQTVPGKTVVTVAPITHSPPTDEVGAVEIPAATKQRLGLDHERSWVIVSEVNRFVWAGPDLRPVSRDNPGQFEYGMLPPALFTRIKSRLVEYARQGKTALLTREQ